MQTVFLDVTTEQLSHNHTLQSYMEGRDMKPADQNRYIRIPLQNKSVHALQNMLTRITIEECVYWASTTGGVMSGYCSMARLPIEIAPNTTIITDNDMANIGLRIKKLFIFASSICC